MQYIDRIQIQRLYYEQLKEKETFQQHRLKTFCTCGLNEKKEYFYYVIRHTFIYFKLFTFVFVCLIVLFCISTILLFASIKQMDLGLDTLSFLRFLLLQFFNGLQYYILFSLVICYFSFSSILFIFFFYFFSFLTAQNLKLFGKNNNIF